MTQSDFYSYTSRQHQCFLDTAQPPWFSQVLLCDRFYAPKAARLINLSPAFEHILKKLHQSVAIPHIFLRERAQQLFANSVPAQSPVVATLLAMNTARGIIANPPAKLS